MTTLTIECPPYMRVYTSEATGLDHARWEVSTAIAKAGFKPACLSLGTDLPKAIAIVQGDLLPRLRKFQAGASAISVSTGPVPGSVDELVHAYMTDKTSLFHECSAETKKEIEDLLAKGCNHVIREGEWSGMRFGLLPLDRVKRTDARRLKLEYQVVEKVKVDAITGETSTVVTHRVRRAEKVFAAMRAAFNVAKDIYDNAPVNNPFDKHRFAAREKETKYGATFEDLIATLVAGDQRGLANMATMALAAYDLEIRVMSIPSKLMVEHYKPADRPKQMKITHWKTKRGTWIDLYDEDGEPLYRGLEQRLDACKGDRTTGVLIPMDGTVDKPWCNPNGQLPTAFYTTFRNLMEAAGLPEFCKFTSFRHGGISGTAEAGCTENEMMILSGHVTAAVVQLYVKQSGRARIRARKKVLAYQAELADRMKAGGKAPRVLPNADPSASLA